MSRDSWAAGACSVLSADAGESAYGTAARAASWVALEQPGPWGRRAAVDSHLDHELGAWLDHAVAEVGGRFVLVRSPAEHADPHRTVARRVLVASSRPGSSWLLTGEVDDPEQLRGLDLKALRAGDVDGVARSLAGAARVTEPHLLVCTNGRRDVCCAVRGRPVARATEAAHPGRVWETSHTGGHRFAPTGVLLPSGRTLARLEPADAIAALEAAAIGQLPATLLGTVHDRGLSALHPALQAAESTIRSAIVATGFDDLSAELAGDADDTGLDGEAGADRWQVVVRHRDGRCWRLRVRRTTTGRDRPASCGKPGEPQVGYLVEQIVETPPPGS